MYAFEIVTCAICVPELLEVETVLAVVSLTGSSSVLVAVLIVLTVQSLVTTVAVPEIVSDVPSLYVTFVCGVVVVIVLEFCFVISV